MTLKKLSIVTPCYNCAPTIEETITSILSQNDPNLEYIIIDGGSTDGTVDIIKKYESQLTYWVSEEDEGQADALNKGFAKATGDILAYINGDDFYRPEAFKIVREHWTNEIDFFAGSCDVVKEDGSYISNQCADINNVFEILDLWGVWWEKRQWMQSETFWSKALWEKTGACFDNQWFIALDYDLWCRFFAAGMRVKQINTPLAAFRRIDGQKTDDALLVENNLLDAMKFNFDKMQPLLNTEQQNYLLGQYYFYKEIRSLEHKPGFKMSGKLGRQLKGLTALLKYPSLKHSPLFKERFKKSIGR